MKLQTFLILCSFSLGLALQINLGEAEGAPVPFSWEDCGKVTLINHDVLGSVHFKPTSVEMKPYPPVAGGNATVYSVGITDETITGGTWKTKVYYSGLLVKTVTGNVCDATQDCQCPCPAGNHTTMLSVDIPSFAPSGTYKGAFTSEDQNGKTMSCINYVFGI